MATPINLITSQKDFHEKTYDKPNLLKLPTDVLRVIFSNLQCNEQLVTRTLSKDFCAKFNIINEKEIKKTNLLIRDVHLKFHPDLQNRLEVRDFVEKMIFPGKTLDNLLKELSNYKWEELAIFNKYGQDEPNLMFVGFEQKFVRIYELAFFLCSVNTYVYSEKNNKNIEKLLTHEFINSQSDENLVMAINLTTLLAQLKIIEGFVSKWKYYSYEHVAPKIAGIKENWIKESIKSYLDRHDVSKPENQHPFTAFGRPPSGNNVRF